MRPAVVLFCLAALLNVGTGAAGQDWSTQSDFVIDVGPRSDSALTTVYQIVVAAGGAYVAILESGFTSRLTVWNLASLQAPVAELGPRNEAAPFGEPSRIQADSAGLWVLYANDWGRFSFDGVLLDVAPGPSGSWQSVGMLSDHSFLVIDEAPSPNLALTLTKEDPQVGQARSTRFICGRSLDDGYPCVL